MESFFSIHASPQFSSSIIVILTQLLYQVYPSPPHSSNVFSIRSAALAPTLLSPFPFSQPPHPPLIVKKTSRRFPTITCTSRISEIPACATCPGDQCVRRYAVLSSVSKTVLLCLHCYRRCLWMTLKYYHRWWAHHARREEKKKKKIHAVSVWKPWQQRPSLLMVLLRRASEGGKWDEKHWTWWQK